MGQVIAAFTMSLDGFIAGPHDEIDPLFRWYSSGDTPFPVAGAERSFKVSQASADVLGERFSSIGAIVTGRRDFDVSQAWGGVSPLGVPIFVVTHRPPAEWSGPGSPFTFVPEGVAHAVALAKQATGAKNVAVGSSTTTQQCLQAGLLDEIHIDLAPLLLTAGVRLFEHLGVEPRELEQIAVVAAPGVTHLRYRVVT